jgi:hypothetical protein
LVNHESGAVFGWCVMNIDITEQRQAKTTLAERGHELSLIIETIPAFAWSASMLAVLLPLASTCFAQSVPTQAPPTASAPQRPAYNLDRSEDDWQPLPDPSQREDFWDPLKYIPLGREGWYLTVAGEIRPFYEIYHNYNWGAGPQSPNGYYLQRFMGSTDLHLGGRTRVFVELRSGDVFGRNGGPRPDAHVEIIVSEIVPYPLPLDEPPVLRPFWNHRYRTIVEQAGIDLESSPASVFGGAPQRQAPYVDFANR